MRFAQLVEWAEGYNRRGVYSPIGVGFHWIMAAAVVFQLGFGWYLGYHMVGADKHLGYQLHGEIGLTIMAVGALRFLWSRHVSGPGLVDEDSLSGKLSGWLQLFFYFCFFALPISGWVMWSTLPGDLPLSIAGLIPVPNLPFDQLSFKLQAELMRDAANIHQILIWALMLAIPGHGGAAFLHYLVKRDKVLHAMLPDFNGPEVEGLVGAAPDNG